MPALPSHPTQLYLIRHGEVEERYHKVFGGSRIDMGLSSLGQRQAHAVADWLADAPVEAVYASPMARVQQTMGPFVGAKKLTPTILPGLREVDFGDWTGHTWTGVKDNFGVSAYDWLEVLDRAGIPNGESAAHLVARVQPCLTQILAENAHRSAAVFCHGGIIRVILSLLLELPLAKTAHFNIEYGSISIVDLQPEKKHAVELNLLNYCPVLPNP